MATDGRTTQQTARVSADGGRDIYCRRKWRPNRFSVGLVLLMISNCICGLNPENYDRSCDVDDDCFVLREPCCDADVGAVSIAEIDRVQRDRDAMQWTCPLGVDCIASPAEAVCRKGLCKARTPDRIEHPDDSGALEGEPDGEP